MLWLCYSLFRYQKFLMGYYNMEERYKMALEAIIAAASYRNCEHSVDTMRSIAQKALGLK